MKKPLLRSIFKTPKKKAQNRKFAKLDQRKTFQKVINFKFLRVLVLIKLLNSSSSLVNIWMHNHAINPRNLWRKKGKTFNWKWLIWECVKEFKNKNSFQMADMHVLKIGKISNWMLFMSCGGCTAISLQMLINWGYSIMLIFAEQRKTCYDVNAFEIPSVFNVNRKYTNCKWYKNNFYRIKRFFMLQQLTTFSSEFPWQIYFYALRQNQTLQPFRNCREIIVIAFHRWQDTWRILISLLSNMKIY